MLSWQSLKRVSIEDKSENKGILEDLVHMSKLYTQKEVLEMLHDIVSERESLHISADEVFEEFSKKVNYNGSAYYEIPTSPAKYAKKNVGELDGIIRDYLFLVKDNVAGMIDNADRPKALKINVQLRTLGQKDTDKVISIIEEFIDSNFPKKDLKLEFGGSVLV